MRSESHTRTANRQQRQERKKQEKERELEELRRLKNLKRREVDSRLMQLSHIAGNNVEGLGGQLDLDEDFDPQAYDQSMAEVFGDEYYEGGEDEGKPDIGGECSVCGVCVLVASCCVHAEEELWDEEFHCEDPGFNVSHIYLYPPHTTPTPTTPPHLHYTHLHTHYRWMLTLMLSNKNQCLWMLLSQQISW